MLVDSQLRICSATFEITSGTLGPKYQWMPLQLSTPILYFQTAQSSGEFPLYLAALPIVGLNPTGLQGLYLLSFKSKEIAQSQ